MASQSVVISEVFGGGGNPGSTYKNDFVELHNLTGAPIDITGYSIQYASAAGNVWQVTPLVGTIPAHGYFLVQEAAGANNTTTLPTPDSIGSIPLSSTSGKVALVQGTTPLSGTSPASSSYLDLVGYGTANGSEGSPAPGTNNTLSVMRVAQGEQDTDNNAADFITGTPDPQNSQSAPLCYVTGTLIRTGRGDVAVEALRVGDLAVTASGALRPITWIGHRALEAAGKVLAHDQQPVRIRAGAFGHDASGRSVPARDLRLSPGHPVLVGADADSQGGHLVPVMCLINGTSITRETSATTVTYWHVELDAHDILLAEGLPAESYYDMGSRVWFAGRDGALIDIDFVPAGAHGRCRSVTVEGAVVEAEHRRLDGVFAAHLAAQCAWREPAVA